MKAPGGDVAVTLASKTEMQKVSDPGEEVLGYYHERDRFVMILRSLTAEQRWRVYWHEWAHVLLEDSGLSNGITLELEEALCDAIAAARMRERFG